MSADKQTQSELRGEEIASQFNKNLLANPEVIQYLVNRGIRKSTIDAGYLGFCPPYVEHWFPLLKGRIIVPIRSVHGDIVAFAGRQYEPLAEMTARAMWDRFGSKPADAQSRIDKWKRAKWINEPYVKSKNLYFLDIAKDSARKEGYINVMEGYLDVQITAQSGLLNTVATCGTALTDWHCALIKRYCDHVALILDGDSAGSLAREKMTTKLREYKLQPHALVLPEGYDPDDYIREIGGVQAKKLFDYAVHNDIPLLNLPKAK